MDVKEISPYDVAVAYKQVFATQEGQIVMADLLRYFGYTRNSTFDPNPGAMAYKEGQRAVLIHVGRQLDLNLAELDAIHKPTGDM